MTTPDTEWEEIANQIGLATYGGVSFQANPEYVEKIRNIITSRDTYWKERVRKNVGDYANQKFLAGTVVDPLELYEAVTNEDNLK